MHPLRLCGLLVLTLSCVSLKAQDARPNFILFVADGLRASSVTAQDMPHMRTFADAGVAVTNSHSLFPTFTMANASALATGHKLGDTGIFSNSIFTGFAVRAAQSSMIPFIENDAILTELDGHYHHMVGEETFLSASRKAGYSTAAMGKHGPAFLQDFSDSNGNLTLVFDDTTGNNLGGATVPSEISKKMEEQGIPLKCPSRGANGNPGDFQHAGTIVSNKAQQDWFVDVATKVLLPWFKKNNRPFSLVYWSRDPDGTQHNQGDSLGRLEPGINGPTSRLALKNVDENFAALLDALQKNGLADNTDIFITADHGFSTISKQAVSYASSLKYPDVTVGLLPPGFLAIDLAHALHMKIFEAADKSGSVVIPEKGQYPRQAALGTTSENPAFRIAQNGGSDLIYLADTSTASVGRLLDALFAQDYVSGVFIDPALGTWPGTLPLTDIGLKGSSKTPMPSIVVGFKSTSTGCSNALLCAAVVSDTNLQQGQGMHGSFSRSDTNNFMAAGGPAFRRQFADPLPASNADVAQTFAYLGKFSLSASGSLPGRVLRETLSGTGHTDDIAISRVIRSEPTEKGVRTVLKMQQYAGEDYYDAGGFPGRTIGL